MSEIEENEGRFYKLIHDAQKSFNMLPLDDINIQNIKTLVNGYFYCLLREVNDADRELITKLILMKKGKYNIAERYLAIHYNDWYGFKIPLFSSFNGPICPICGFEFSDILLETFKLDINKRCPNCEKAKLTQLVVLSSLL